MNIFRHWLLVDFLTLRCGGGGGGDGGASEREAARQARIDQATKAVNAIFGKDQASKPVAPSRSDYVRQRAAATPTTGGDDGSLALYHMLHPQPKAGGSEYFDSGAYNAAMARYQDQMDRYNSVSNAAKARDQMYNQVADDTRDYYSKQLGEDAAQAQRDQRFLAARNGTFGSSQAIDMQREFDRRNDRGLLDIANRADSAATNMRSADDKSRIDLISRIVNGADQASATSSALSQLQTNAETARNEAQQGRMANVFAGALDAWKAYQTAAGNEAARQQFDSQYGNFFSNNTGNSYQGTVTR